MLWRQLQDKVWKTWKEHPRAGSDPEIQVELITNRPNEQSVRWIPITRMSTSIDDETGRPVILLTVENDKGEQVYTPAHYGND